MLRRARTILRSIFLPSPEWEAVEEIERENSALHKRLQRLRCELEDFCERVERGEIRSTRTHSRFMRALSETEFPRFDSRVEPLQVLKPVNNDG